MGQAPMNRRVVIASFALGCLSVAAAPRVTADGAEPPGEGQAARGIISRWQLLFPEQSYVCWQKESPWDGLDRLQPPPAGVKALPTISVDMGRNEYESTSFVLTSLSETPVEFRIACDPTGIAVTLRKAVWVTLDDGSRVNDALSLIDNDRVVLPPGESLEIWVTLHGNGAAAGTYEQTITVSPKGHTPRAVEIAVMVHDLSLPESLPLAVTYFDEIVATWSNMAPALVEAYMKDMKSHYVNHAFVHPDPLPRLAVDADGRLVTDYDEFDRALDGYKTLAPRRFAFFWAAEAFLEPSGDWSPAHPESIGRPEYMTPEWKRLFRQWLTEWVAHMKARGIGYDGFIMHPYDERGGPEVQAIVKQIKAVDPNILVLFNGALGRTAEEIENHIAPYIDVWMPHLYHYLDVGGVHGGISQVVAVKPDTAYTVSFYGKNGGCSIYWDVMFDGSTSRHANGLDASLWRQATISFTTAADTTRMTVRFFPTLGNKTILIDDVVLSSGAGPNLIVNGDMEAGDLPADWPATSATVVANTMDPHAGRQCAEIKNIPKSPGPEKAMAKKLLGKEKDFFWTYANPTGIGPTKASPYSAYRLPVWRAWKEGMNGFSTWCYKGGRWDSAGKGPNWGMVYVSDQADCPAEVSRKELVVPSKRWEASREGVEDYAYLHLLKQAIQDGSPGLDAEKAKALLAFWTEEVLAKEDNPRLADKAKKQAMEAFVKLSPSGPPERTEER